MNEQLEKYFPDKYEIIDAVHYDDKIVINTYNDLTSINTSVYALSQIAISLSHLKCMNEIYKKKYKWAAIIEDDIRLTNNFDKQFNKYLDKCNNLNEELPTIIHLCGNPNLKQNKYEFIETKPIVNTCFYIINLKYAELFIKSFFPIKYQVDTYVYYINSKNSVKEYISVPLLSWDLSTTIYANWWSKDDEKMHNSITSLSSIKKIEKKNRILSSNINRNFLDPKKCNKIYDDSEKWVLKLEYLSNNLLINGDNKYNDYCEIFPLDKIILLELNFNE
jgi:GR25 family glycosyltransferase involved in LPS biosynthesis